MNNLIEAVNAAIDFSKTATDPSLTACVLTVYENSTFVIAERCWPNSSSSGMRALVPGELDRYHLTIKSTDYPAMQYPFRFLEFAVKYSIKLN